MLSAIKSLLSDKDSNGTMHYKPVGKECRGLFVDPDSAEKGIGKKLHRLMIDWYFLQTEDKVVFGTSPNTRAERFYTLQGWTPVGSYSNGETKFEFSYTDWTHL